MSKSLFNPAEMAKGGSQFSWPKGNGKITGAVVAAVTHRSKGGEEFGPFLIVNLTVMPLDAQFKPAGDEPKEIELPLGRAKDLLEVYRPGQWDEKKGKVKDLGADPGTEGDAIFFDEAANESRDKPLQLFRDSQWAVFMESVVKAGFDEGQIGNSIGFIKGLVGNFETVKGRKYTAKDGTEKTEDNFICHRVATFPYEGKSAGGAGKAEAKTEKASGGKKTADKKEDDAKPAKSGNGGDELEQLSDVGAKVIEAKAGKKLTTASFRVAFMPLLTKMDGGKELIAWMKDDDNLAALIEALGLEEEDGAIQIPE